MYYIASLAKFGNCCSTVLAHRQDQWEGNNHRVFCFEGGKKKLDVVLQRIFGRDFLSHVLQYFRVLKTIRALACLVILIVWHSCYRA